MKKPNPKSQKQCSLAEDPEAARGSFGWWRSFRAAGEKGSSQAGVPRSHQYATAGP